MSTDLPTEGAKSAATRLLAKLADSGFHIESITPTRLAPTPDDPLSTILSVNPSTIYLSHASKQTGSRNLWISIDLNTLLKKPGADIVVEHCGDSILAPVVYNGALTTAPSDAMPADLEDIITELENSGESAALAVADHLRCVASNGGEQATESCLMEECESLAAWATATTNRIRQLRGRGRSR